MSPWRVHDPTYESDAVNPDLDVSPWAGHRGFAYDLLVWRRPQLVLELGTHYGCSFFAFAQAVKDHALPSRVVAVDTWQGDAHAGEYGDEVIEAVSRTVADHFYHLDLTLVRKTFLDARDDVTDGSIDVLHIDGFHSYEAVREDYETWLGKLAPDGIVLFHDVAQDNGYESPRFWREISAQHPSFDFPHSFGLGVLFPKGNRWHSELQEQGVLQWLPYYRFRAEARLAQRQLADTRQQLEARWKVVEALEEQVRHRDGTITAQSALIQARDEAIAAQAALIRARDETITAQTTLIQARDEALAAQVALIQSRDEAVAAQAGMLDERWSIMERNDQEISTLHGRVAELEASLHAASDAVAQLPRPSALLRHGAERVRARLSKTGSSG